ncbi:sugar ABC transporter substrate-binding protein [Burkholderia sp. ABCPW 11]|uniref:sugar ABC transporter substrate-binding protein n=1 Tax=Burkholderia sp. ABCPW 11 TaxID=1637859 RepID=UPI000757BA38|nr:sugar ABC transporter substrate-binding protein [Burkholderia sp. ABCPW 11]KVD46845.1 sugar ABC transporter substrate-binding protein [Burkholderia sp. ABCPW 11]
MKVWKQIAVAVFGLAVLATSASAADKKFVIGYTNLADTDVFTMSRKTAFADAVKADPGLSVVYTDANGDVSRQLDQIDNFIAQKVNVIMIVPVDYRGIVPGVERANKAGIPVIALGIQSAGGKYTFVGSKNYDAGRLQGEYFDSILPKNAQILYLQGTPGLYHSKERLAGFVQTLAKRPDVKILSNLPADYDRAQGMKVTEDWVQRYPKFDAIVAANDQMALGALEALKTAGRLKGVAISGVDGTADAMRAIKAGEMSQTIFQNAKGQAQAAYQVVETLKSGKPAPAEVIVPFESVTRNNVGNYLK